MVFWLKVFCVKQPRSVLLGLDTLAGEEQGGWGWPLGTWNSVSGASRGHLWEDCFLARGPSLLQPASPRGPAPPSAGH